MGLILRGDDDYERARVGRVFNHRRPSRYPKAVIEPSSEAEVIDAVRYARDNSMRISIRSGGHSWAAWSIRYIMSTASSSLANRPGTILF